MLPETLTPKTAYHGAGTTVPILCELHLPLQLSTPWQIAGRRSKRNNCDNPADKFAFGFFRERITLSLYQNWLRGSLES